jgi:F-type H+-transporting ATPase subunit c
MIALQIMHACSIALCTVAATCGVARSHGKTATESFDAIDRQPAMRPEITRSTIVALALIETAAILGLLMSLFIFYSPPRTFAAAVGELGMALAVGLPGLVIGWSSAEPAIQALHAISKQPFISRSITNYMLVILSLMQTPFIFGFIMALLIHRLLPTTTTIAQGLMLLGAGITIGVGTIGPVIGSRIFTKKACQGAGRNRHALSRLFTFTLVSQAIIETPILFSIIISLMLMNRAVTPFENPIIGWCYLVFGLTMGVGTFGTGISSGRVAAAAADQISYHPEAYTILSRGSMLAQGIIDTIAIYSLIISLWLMLTFLA